MLNGKILNVDNEGHLPDFVRQVRSSNAYQDKLADSLKSLCVAVCLGNESFSIGTHSTHSIVRYLGNEHVFDVFLDMTVCGKIPVFNNAY